MLQAIKYNDGNLTILDQLQIPYTEEYVSIRTTEEAWHAIRDMRVRGAPAIAIVAALSLASELSKLISNNILPTRTGEVREIITDKLQYLMTSRPTAVNLHDTSCKIMSLVAKYTSDPAATGYGTAILVIQEAESMLVKDLDDNQRIGQNGANWIMANTIDPGSPKATVLTHCNTGFVLTLPS